MEIVIQQAYEHEEEDGIPLGPLIANRRYEIVRTDGMRILPEFWNSVIQPLWEIRIVLWALPQVAKLEKHSRRENVTDGHDDEPGTPLMHGSGPVVAGNDLHASREGAFRAMLEFRARSVNYQPLYINNFNPSWSINFISNTGAETRITENAGTYVVFRERHDTSCIRG